MRKIGILFLILSGVLFAVPAVSQADPTGFAIRETFVQCTSAHFRGTKEAPIEGTMVKVRLHCSDFWKDLHNPQGPSPFSFIASPGPGSYQGDIPLNVWRPAIEDALQITPEPK